MKLNELGLKQKPQTKYFEGGYVSFSTLNQKLYYAITMVNKRGNYQLIGGEIPNRKQLDNLLSAKTIDDIGVWIQA